jgi:hypothetical protein
MTIKVRFTTTNDLTVLEVIDWEADNGETEVSLL